MNNIYLIGMMGSGKSTIGLELSKKLNMDFTDTDNDIESIHQMKIHEIFYYFGEEKFREMESAYFIEKSKEGNRVFSTGGGIILNKKNQNTLMNTGTTFLLDVDCETLVERIEKSKNRPLILGGNSSQIIEELWEGRKKYYYDSSNHVIKATNLEIEQIIAEIINIIRSNEIN
tara:strand:- start:761 stop:1279 length:519 start_codon:yes stop_codon:yes gene_type:complete